MAAPCSCAISSARRSHPRGWIRIEHPAINISSSLISSVPPLRHSAMARFHPRVMDEIGPRNWRLLEFEIVTSAPLVNDSGSTPQFRNAGRWQRSCRIRWIRIEIRSRRSTGVIFIFFCFFFVKVCEGNASRNCGIAEYRNRGKVGATMPELFE